MKKQRFKINTADMQIRYEHEGILYTANAKNFTVEQVEEAFDKGLFVPGIDWETKKTIFTKQNKPVYYLLHYALMPKAIVNIIIIDDKKFNNKIINAEDITGFGGREYKNCTFYDCKLLPEHNNFKACRFIRCIIDGVEISDCTEQYFVE